MVEQQNISTLLRTDVVNNVQTAATPGSRLLTANRLKSTELVTYALAFKLSSLAECIDNATFS